MGSLNIRGTISAVVLLLASGSPSSVFTSASAHVPRNSPIPRDSLVHVHTSYESGVVNRLRVLVRGSADWEELWRQISGPSARVPKVSFNSEMVIVAAAGPKPSTGHSIQIDSVVVRSSRASVYVVEVGPGPDCLAGGLITHPIDAVRVPVFDVPVRFVEKQVVLRCT